MGKGGKVKEDKGLMETTYNKRYKKLARESPNRQKFLNVREKKKKKKTKKGKGKKRKKKSFRKRRGRGKRAI